MSATASGGGANKWVMVVGFGLLLLLVLLALRGLATALPEQRTTSTATPQQCPTTFGGTPVFLVRLSQTDYPYSTAHIDDARTVLGKPWVLTLDRPGAAQRRYQATHNFTRVAGQQPDEYPPAIAVQGGLGADVRNIPSADNQGAGASMGNQLRNTPDGALFCIELTP
ncbi:MAG TPA: NucA/NucB deoxyribonuclease domain-containing protein [Ktedonobacterales bacterium]|nr:NucA/NucB deoxyribonuclease domain-containing protein [Ktedonobacterales bacterium]